MSGGGFASTMHTNVMFSSKSAWIFCGLRTKLGGSTDEMRENTNCKVTEQHILYVYTHPKPILHSVLYNIFVRPDVSQLFYQYVQRDTTYIGRMSVIAPFHVCLNRFVCRIPIIIMLMMCKYTHFRTKHLLMQSAIESEAAVITSYIPQIISTNTFTMCTHTLTGAYDTTKALAHNNIIRFSLSLSNITAKVAHFDRVSVTRINI